jgi:membrane-associated phospholipid phosphatase
MCHTSGRVRGVALVAAVAFAGLALAAPAPAQTTAEQVNDVVSYGTVTANVVADALHAWTSEDRGCALTREALSVAIAVAAGELLKAVIHERRPDGSDTKSFPSGHTALAFATSGWSTRFGLTLGIGTGVERVTANKHHWYDVTAGALVGEGARWGSRAALPCRRRQDRPLRYNQDP